MAEQENRNVLDCVNTVNTNFLCSFILVGGASMIKRRCDRSTTDVDVVVPTSTDMHKLVRQLTDTGWFYLKDGVLFVKPSSSPSGQKALKLDILKEIVDNKTFEDLIRHTTTIGDNIMLTLPMSLGVKLKCWYLRQEDENGMAKKDTDLQDIVFVAKKMKGEGLEVDHNSAAALKICHYNLLLIRLELEEVDIELLRAVGCSRFLKEYDEDTPDQKELYEAMGAKAGTDPLTVELEFEDEFEGEFEDE
jgi:hypothetical protein